jgi:hypothetical protein
VCLPRRFTEPAVLLLLRACLFLQEPVYRVCSGSAVQAFRRHITERFGETRLHSSDTGDKMGVQCDSTSAIR